MAKVIHNCSEYYLIRDGRTRLKIIWCWRAAFNWRITGQHFSPLAKEINCPRCIKLILKYYSRHTPEHFKKYWGRKWYLDMVQLHNNLK